MKNSSEIDRKNNEQPAEDDFIRFRCLGTVKFLSIPMGMNDDEKADEGVII